MPAPFGSRPTMLTSAAVKVAASVSLFDPISQGLAISLVGGGSSPAFPFRGRGSDSLYMDTLFTGTRYELAHGQEIGPPG